MTADLVTFECDRLAIRFERFGLPEYELFLKAKRLPESAIEVSDELNYRLTAPARFAPLLGLPLPPAGQRRALRVHLPVIAKLEGDMLDTIFAKQAQHEAAIAEMEQNYVAARSELEDQA
jgi:hypothetical protein